MEQSQASHYRRLKSYGLEKDIRYCISQDVANVLPFYEEGKLVIHKGEVQKPRRTEYIV
jgi:2-phosphosulfolactate phosphatase